MLRNQEILQPDSLPEKLLQAFIRSGQALSLREICVTLDLTEENFEKLKLSDEDVSVLAQSYPYSFGGIRKMFPQEDEKLEDYLHKRS